MIDDREVAFMPALELGGLLRKREVTSSELVEVYLRRIEALNDRLGAYVTVAADVAGVQAEVADAALQAVEDLPPLFGVPISIKDLADTAGIRTTHGTAEWHDRVPDRDDAVVARIKRAGMPLLGKTIVPEFGPLSISEPPGYPPGRNPWDPTRSAGGSSGGAAASVVAGLCPLAHGSDGGGSIRNPSAWCGVFGLKPSRGRVSAAPEPQRFFSIDGPIARTVADASALLDVMAGYETGDAYWAPPADHPFLQDAQTEPPPLRIAYHPHPGVQASAVEPAHLRAAEEAAELLGELGHRVELVEPPIFGPDDLMAAATAFAVDHASRAAERPPPETLDPWTRTLMGMGTGIPGTIYVQAMRSLQTASRKALAFFGDFDLLVTPTVAQAPPPVGSLEGVGVEDMAAIFAMTPFTSMWNTTGQPAASLPVGLDENGLPVGVQLVAGPAAESTLIQVCAQVESARPWADRRPPVS